MENIYLIGFMGSGKSSYGRRVAPQVGRTLYDTDILIEKQNQATIREIINKKGEPFFRQKEREILLQSAQWEKALIATGGGLPCFHNNIETVNKQGISIYLKWSTRELVHNIRGSKADRPLLDRMNNRELTNYIQEKLIEREPHYKQATYILEDPSPRALRQLIHQIDSMRLPSETNQICNS